MAGRPSNNTSNAQANGGGGVPCGASRPRAGGGGVGPAVTNAYQFRRKNRLTLRVSERLLPKRSDSSFPSTEKRAAFTARRMHFLPRRHNQGGAAGAIIASFSPSIVVFSPPPSIYRVPLRAYPDNPSGGQKTLPKWHLEGLSG